MNKEKKESASQSKEFLIDVITAKLDSNDIYVVPMSDGIAIPLNWFLGLISNCRGTWQSLGMAYNPGPGSNCMELAIYYVVPKDCHFQEMVTEMIDRIKGASVNEELDETGNRTQDQPITGTNK